MNKYKILINILDKICEEAPAKLTRYHPKESECDSQEIYLEKKNQARSRALVHLYLLVSFGLLDFNEREYFITDNAYDGGIDAYYIDSDLKTVYFIQSKFRTSERNFTTKNIQLEEILAMDVNRVLEGETTDEAGNEYNGKIKQLIRDITKIEDIGRYRYKVIVMANLENVANSKLKILAGGFPVELFDYEKCYQKLVFPVVSGTYFNASDLSIFIDLSNKNAGAKISYSVKTQYKDCEITALFVPTIEIAKILYKYKNSILKFNPRSYLELAGSSVNEAVRNSILEKVTNEFALFNNGITMLSDETFINEKIGQKNKANLTVKNPQIINGGQTGFTLSKIYEENLSNNVELIFQEKEVLLKIITFVEDEKDVNDEKKYELIEEISTATNKQTAVTNADRLSNNKIQSVVQKRLFNNYGIFYERKRGEFADGLSSNYISDKDVLERNLFYKLYFSSQGRFNVASRKNLFKKEGSILIDLDEKKLDKFYFSYLCYRELIRTTAKHSKERLDLFERVFLLTTKFFVSDKSLMQDAVTTSVKNFEFNKMDFNDYLSKKYSGTVYVKDVSNAQGVIKKKFNTNLWRRREDFIKDYEEFFLINNS